MKLSDNIKPILALTIIGLSFTYFFLMMFVAITPDPQVIIAIIAFGTTALNYYFGSTTGQAKKDEVIADLTKK